MGSSSEGFSLGLGADTCKAAEQSPSTRQEADGTVSPELAESEGRGMGPRRRSLQVWQLLVHTSLLEGWELTLVVVQCLGNPDHWLLILFLSAECPFLLLACPPGILPAAPGLLPASLLSPEGLTSCSHRTSGSY